jgi:hypothetical protein
VPEVEAEAVPEVEAEAVPEVETEVEPGAAPEPEAADLEPEYASANTRSQEEEEE